jgi:hypothetical protein
MPPPNGRHYEEEKILWRQTIIGYYRFHLNSPPETPYKTNERFQGWYGDDGVIAHVMGRFILVGEYDKMRIKMGISECERMGKHGGVV